MYSIEAFIHSFSTDAEMCIRLFHKIPDGGLDYRPTAKQRSTLELLRYLSYGPYNVARRIVAGDWSIGMPANEATKDMPVSDFPRNIRHNVEDLARILRAADPVALERDLFTFPWNVTCTKAEGLVNYPLKWMAGYRMQLFLYLKSAGVSELATKDLWVP